MKLKQSQKFEQKVHVNVNPTTASILELPSGSLKKIWEYASSNLEELESRMEGKEEDSGGIMAPFSFLSGQSNEEKDGEGFILQTELVDRSEAYKESKTPQARYTQADSIYEKPGIELSDSLNWEPSMEQVKVPSEYDNASKFLTTLKNSAEWAMDTLKDVYMEIREEQREFLNSLDPANLKKFTQEDLADKIGVSNSTVSRLVEREELEIDTGSERYRMPVKSLLTSYTDIRREAVAQEMNELLEMEYEDGEALSDSDISEALTPDISRRTVAKYRKESGVPGSKDRSNNYETRESPYQVSGLDLDIKEV